MTARSPSPPSSPRRIEAAPGSQAPLDAGRTTVRVLDVTKSTTKDVSYPAGGRVSGLMEAVEAAFGVPAKRQRLICAGRIMRADDLVSSYKLGVFPGGVTTIHLFPRASDAPPARTPHHQTPGLSARFANRGVSREQQQILEDEALATRLALQWQGGPLASVSAGSPDDELRADPERGLPFADVGGPDAADLGTPREFLVGFVMGAVLGFIMLLYLWERSVSHRQKMGILAGATAQLFFKYIHSVFEATAAGDSQQQYAHGAG